MRSSGIVRSSTRAAANRSASRMSSSISWRAVVEERRERRAVGDHAQEHRDRNAGATRASRRHSDLALTRSRGTDQPRRRLDLELAVGLAHREHPHARAPPCGDVGQ